MNLIERAKNIVLQPKSEWPVIAAEETSVAELYRNYVVPLAAIAPVALFLGTTLVGTSMPFVGTVRMPFASGLAMALVSYVMALVGVFVIALIIDALAPSFGGEKNQVQALKLAVYSYTPGWVASVLYVIPMLAAVVMLASLYGLYLLYLGLPVLMKAPQDKAGVYAVVVVVCAILVSVVLGAVTGMFGGFGHYGMH